VLPASLTALALIVFAAVVLNRKGHLTPWQALYGSLGALTNVLLGGALSMVVLVLLGFLGRLPPLQAPSWIAHPLAMHVGFAALTLLSTTAVAAWFARGAGFWGLWFGGAMLVALLSLASALAAPAAGFVLLLAAAAAALGCGPSLVAAMRDRTPSQGAGEFAALLPGLIAFAALLPMLLLLYSALGAPAWPIGTVSLCVVAGFLLPLLGNATRSVRQRLAVIAAATTFGAICITVLLPTYSASWPQRMNVEYWVNADSGNAHWWMQAASQHLPRAMGEALKFDPVPRERFRGYPLKGFFADAPALKLAAPELTQISNSGTTPRARVELRLRSLRGAALAFVIFPANANIQEIEVATPSGPLRAKLHRLRNGSTVLQAPGIPEAGLLFAIDAPAAPMTIQVFDGTYGLPEELPDGKTLQRARPKNATSSQDGDVTVVQRTVHLNPAAGR
jgi:hypothetical protein